MMSYMDLNVYYRFIFNLMQHHKYSLSDIYKMYPYERDIFVTLLEEWLKEQEEKDRLNSAGP